MYIQGRQAKLHVRHVRAILPHDLSYLPTISCLSNPQDISHAIEWDFMPFEQLLRARSGNVCLVRFQVVPLMFRLVVDFFFFEIWCLILSTSRR
jgi:hypothetical protein